MPKETTAFLKRNSKELIKICDRLIDECLQQGSVSSTSTAPFKKLYKFEQAKLGINVVQNRKNAWIMWISLLVSITSLGVALAALNVAYQSNILNDRWASNQLTILETLSENTSPTIDIKNQVSKNTPYKGVGK